MNLKLAVLALIFLELGSAVRGKQYRWARNASAHTASRRVMVGHVFQVFNTKYMAIQCAFECLRRPRCKSYNFDKESHTCEVNDASHVDFPQTLVNSTSFDYYHRDFYSIDKEALGFCVSEPCQHQGQCVDTKSDDGHPVYFCLCEKGWKGFNCEAEVLNPVWGMWTAWEPCSVTCGHGWQVRHRTCQNFGSGTAQQTAECPGDDDDYQTCIYIECPRWSNWSTWGQCSARHTCGMGHRVRTRTCLNGGKVGVDRYCLGNNQQFDSCREIDCKAPIYLVGGPKRGEGRVEVYNDITGQWGLICADQWDMDNANTACRQLGLGLANADNRYGSGTKQFSVKELNCTGNEWSIQSCVHNPWVSEGNCSGLDVAAGVQCKVNGAWSLWSSWNDCSVTCENGTRVRKKQCNHPPPLHGGLDCPGNSTETLPCTLPFCPVDGIWSIWSVWDACTLSCGGGTQNRTRTCFGPFHNGHNCTGSAVETQLCSKNECPVNGIWMDWSHWTSCSHTCDKGVHTRIRSCYGPFFNGQDCEGLTAETQNCKVTECSVPGNWFEWEPWSKCTVTCGGGKQTRTRVCNMDSYGNRTTPCIGANTYTRNCHDFTCEPARSCTEWRQRGLDIDVEAEIDPDGSGVLASIQLPCNMTDENGVGVTIIGHDSEGTVQVKGYKGAGESVHHINYNISFDHVIAIIDASASCKQYLRWQCLSSVIHHQHNMTFLNTYWINRTGGMADYFGGAAPGSHSCGCGITSSCANTNYVCNCDINDNVWREDSGYLMYKKDLPVTAFHAGSTGGAEEDGYRTIGPLLCSG